MVDLSGKSALVTGATKGIGLAVARMLAEAGAAVSVSARTASEVDATVESIAADSEARVVGFPCDVRRLDNCAELVERTVEGLGGLDILVNNAGVGGMMSIKEMSGDDWRRVIDTNLSGVFYLSKAALPHLTASDFAWIINIGSLAGRNAFAGGTAYNASKFGLLGMTEAMMLDLRYDGIRVSVVMPGSVDTGFGRSPGLGQRPWALGADDVGRAVMQLLEYPENAHVSKVEMRPAQPPRG